jgi:hypothetical protein
VIPRAVEDAMGKAYPMWVQDKFEFAAVPEKAKDTKKITLALTYKRECKSHDDETAFHTTAKKDFGEKGRAKFGKNYVHNGISVSKWTGDNEPAGTSI